MGFADLHIHTLYSWDGTCTVSAVLKRVADYTDIRVIAIADHDNMDGAWEAVELAPAYGLEVVPGMEVSTADGHVLALFIETAIPKGLSLEETLSKVGSQGGLCIAAHPMARGDFSLSAGRIIQTLRDPDLARILVGMETFNAGLVDGRSNLAAQALAQILPIAQVGSSDAHLLWMIGGGYTEFPGTTTADLRQALEQHMTKPVIDRASPPLQLMSGWLSHFLLRKAGWVTSNAGPQAPLRMGRLGQV